MKQLSLLFLAISLSGCVSMRYGNFTNAKESFLARDAASQLKRVYPPAQNTFSIGQKVSDDFGMSLIHAMRKKGYGVIENTPRQNANFFYVVDKVGEAYRVSLYIGSESLSRLYAKTNEKKLLPLSSWSHKA